MHDQIAKAPTIMPHLVPDGTPLDLSVVIVSWNTRDVLRKCLASLFGGLAHDGLSAELFVVDNASEDDTPQMIRNEFPSAVLIVNETNRGFPAANNQALAQARGRYVVLLNPDTVVTQGSLSRLVRFLDANPEYGLAGPMIRSTTGRVQPNCARRFPSPITEFIEIAGLDRHVPKVRWLTWLYSGAGDYETSRDVETLTGACMIIRRRVIEWIGPLDASSFMFGEDVEFCFRARQAGIRARFVREAGIVHLGGESTKVVAQASFPRLASHQAVHEFIKKRQGPSAAAAYRLVTLLGATARLVVALLLAGLRRTGRAYHGGAPERIARRYLELALWAVTGHCDSGVPIVHFPRQRSQAEDASD